MNYQQLTTNKASTTHLMADTPLFSRWSWHALFEVHICNDNFRPFTFVFSRGEKNFILPLAQQTIDSAKQLNSLSNYYSPFYKMVGNSVVTEQDHYDAMSACEAALKKYDIINLLPLYHQDAVTWLKALSAIGFDCLIYQHSVNWYHDGIKDLEHYWSLRPSILRNTLKRKKKKLDKTGEYSTTIIEPDSIESLHKYLADYHLVYNDSWKKSEPFSDFIDAVVLNAWQQNELRLGLVYHQDNPVAAQIWFVNGDTAYIFKLAYRESYAKTSVGTVLTAALIEQVIEKDKVSCIDFLTGDDGYKKDWMQGSRVLYGIKACNKRTFQGNKHRIKNCIAKVRQRLKLNS